MVISHLNYHRHRIIFRAWAQGMLSTVQTRQKCYFLVWWSCFLLFVSIMYLVYKERPDSVSPSPSHWWSWPSQTKGGISNQPTYKLEILDLFHHRITMFYQYGVTHDKTNAVPGIKETQGRMNVFICRKWKLIIMKDQLKKDLEDIVIVRIIWKEKRILGYPL